MHCCSLLGLSLGLAGLVVRELPSPCSWFDSLDLLPVLAEVTALVLISLAKTAASHIKICESSGCRAILTRNSRSLLTGSSSSSSSGVASDTPLWGMGLT